MKEAIRRATRGALQLGLAEAFLRLAIAFGLKLTEDQHVAILGVAMILVTLIQNIVEDKLPDVAEVTRGDEPTD
jgi:hypothetical protein